jgi:hypothetical protein
MDVVGLCNTTRKAAAIHVNDENKMAGPGKIGGACAANNSHHSIVNTLPHSGGGGEGTAKTAEKERGAEDDYVEISAMWARDDATGRNGRGSNDGEGDGGGGNDNREVDDQYKRDSKGQILFDKMGNPVKKVKAERDTSRDDFNVAIHLLRGNGSHGVMHDMSPWQIVAARGAAGSKGLAHPPALRNYRWSYPEQRAADKIGDAAVDLSTPCPRGGHSLVAVNSFTLVAFGGFFCQWEVGGVNRPFADYETALCDDPKVPPFLNTYTRIV